MTRVIPLLENTAAAPQYRKKHGLCLFIETDAHKLLFDVGPNALFLKNAKTLGVDVAAVDTAILSHGHCDHTGGLRAFLNENDTAKIYLRSTAREPHYVKVMGVPFFAGMRVTSSKRFVFTDALTRIDETLALFSDVAPRTPLPASDQKLFVKTDGRIVRDDFRHEQNLILRADGKTILFTGCAHAGIVNIAETARRLFGRIDAIVGGFHLYDPPTGRYESEEYIQKTALALQKTGAECYACHCTGRTAIEQMRPILGGKLHEISTGSVLQWD